MRRIECVKILYALVHDKFRRVVNRLFEHFFNQRNVPVVNMRVGNHVHKLAGDKPRRLREHIEQHGVLHHVPVVCDQHILRALIEYAVEYVSARV